MHTSVTRLTAQLHEHIGQSDHCTFTDGGGGGGGGGARPSPQIPRNQKGIYAGPPYKEYLGNYFSPRGSKIKRSSTESTNRSLALHVPATDMKQLTATAKGGKMGCKSKSGNTGGEMFNFFFLWEALRNSFTVRSHKTIYKPHTQAA